MPNFIALAIYFLFGTKFSWNEGIDICFNVECVILDHNFDFIGGYLVVTARYLVVTTGYCSLLGGYCSLLVILIVTAYYYSFPLLVLMSDNCFERFTGESFGAAILDSGASKTVCGRMWIDCYNESLSSKEKEYPWY